MKVKFNQGDEILEVTMRDSSMARLECRRCNNNDPEDCGRIIKWLMVKWGTRFKFEKGFLDIDSEFLKL